MSLSNINQPVIGYSVNNRNLLFARQLTKNQIDDQSLNYRWTRGNRSRMTSLMIESLMTEVVALEDWSIVQL